MRLQSRTPTLFLLAGILAVGISDESAAAPAGPVPDFDAETEPEEWNLERTRLLLGELSGEEKSVQSLAARVRECEAQLFEILHELKVAEVGADHQSALGKADHPVPNHQMVEYANIDQLQRLAQAFGDMQI